MGQQVCAPWTTPDKLCGTGSGDVTDCGGGTTPLVFKWTPDEVILAASNLLYRRTCFRYPGVCQFSIWPCIDGCCGSHGEGMPCVPCYQGRVILLPSDYTPRSIVEITEDGVVLDPSAYRLERGRIVRLDGKRWQRNNFGLPGVYGVETVITYTAGTAPPIELEMAAAALADEMLQACNGDDCKLDPRVKAFRRRGVEVELNDLLKLLATDLTGIPEVDRVLAIYGNCAGATMLDTAAPYLGSRAN